MLLSRMSHVGAEANDRDLLLKYGSFVRGRPCDVAYADRVRRRVPQPVLEGVESDESWVGRQERVLMAAILRSLP